jgi:hypothetical protein
MTKTETVTIPAAEVRVGDRVSHVSGTVVSISHVPGGFIFFMPFMSFVRNHDEKVTVTR